MNINNVKPVHPNLLVIDTPIKNYSPTELVQFYMDCLDKRIGTYFVLNVSLKTGHKVVISDTHIDTTEFVI